MGIIRIHFQRLLRGDLVIGSELRGGRAYGIGEAGCHEHLGSNPRGQMLHVNISKPGKYLLRAPVLWIKFPEKYL